TNARSKVGWTSTEYLATSFLAAGSARCGTVVSTAIGRASRRGAWETQETSIASVARRSGTVRGVRRSRSHREVSSRRTLIGSRGGPHMRAPLVTLGVLFIASPSFADTDFAPAAFYETGPVQEGVAIGGLDGDGDNALAVLHRDGTLKTLANNGAGIFAAAVSHGTAVGAPPAELEVRGG